MQKIVLGNPRELWLLISQHRAARRNLTTSAMLHTLAAQISIAAIEASLALDALARIFDLPLMAKTGYWTMLLAASCATIGVFAGFITRRRLEKNTPPSSTDKITAAHSALQKHAYLGSLFYVSLVGMAIWRMKLQANSITDVRLSGWYFVALVALSALMIFQVWLGGEAAVKLSQADDDHSEPR